MKVNAKEIKTDWKKGNCKVKKEIKRRKERNRKSLSVPKFIMVTGTPGAGKTLVAKILAKKLGYMHIDLAEEIKKHGLYSGYDKKRDCYIADIKKLKSHIEKKASDAKKGVIADGHLSHELGIKNGICIVVKCGLKELKKRLEKRGYKEEKIRENLDAECFEVCYCDAVENGYKCIVIDNTEKAGSKGQSKILNKILRELNKVSSAP